MRGGGLDEVEAGGGEDGAFEVNLAEGVSTDFTDSVPIRKCSAVNLSQNCPLRRRVDW